MYIIIVEKLTKVVTSIIQNKLVHARFFRLDTTLDLFVSWSLICILEWLNIDKPGCIFNLHKT